MFGKRQILVFPQDAVVTWISVQAGQDHLLRLAQRSGAVASLTELIWNSLDAEADRIFVRIETDSLDPRQPELRVVRRVIVEDNGHGITPSVASTAFASLGDSWKKTLNGRTLNRKWILHGRRGLGRFYAYTLGSNARWTSVSRTPEDGFIRISIEGSTSRANGFEISDPIESPGPAGTIVTVDADPDRPLGALLDAALPDELTAHLAAQLLGHPEISVHVDGFDLQAEPLMASAPVEVELTEVEGAYLGGSEIPRLMLVEWTKRMKRPLGIVLCNEGGASLAEVPESGFRSGPARVTAYLKWSQFQEADLITPELEFPQIIAAAKRRFEEFGKARSQELTTDIVGRLKAEGSYPYKHEPQTSIQAAERNIYDLIVVSAVDVLGDRKEQRAISARLLQLALQERPNDLDLILDETLRLSGDERRLLAEMLRYSTLGSIIEASHEVTRRTELLTALRAVLYDPVEAKKLREVDQLHPFVAENTWLFGEEWQLAQSEVGITNVLRDVLKEHKITIEADLVGGDAGARRLSPDIRGRVDIVLQRTFRGPDQLHRLVVELKRPSVPLGEKELAQTKGYARVLAAHSAMGQSRWSFWLLGTRVLPAIDGERRQRGQPFGRVFSGANYDVWVFEWGELIQSVGQRYAFYDELLKSSITQDQAVERVRARHAALVKPAARPKVEEESTQT